LKRFSLYCALVLFASIFSSCSDSSYPTAQMTQDEPVVRTRVSNVSLIALPAHKEPKSLRKESKVSVPITNATGGTVHIENTYTAVNNKSVSIALTLEFEPGTVAKDCDVSITLDTEHLVADFSPSQTFLKPAKLTATISGLDLSNVPAGKVKLFYIDGMSFDPMEGEVSSDGVSTLTLTGGKIPHFSLYGFGYTR
jgi:hypothetical protein